jgi:putative ABC transport system permease protein
MRNRIITAGLRSVRSSFARFLSLLIMSLLGVCAFAGIQATGPDMIRSLDTYLDSRNAYDIRVASTMGLTEGDISALAAVPGVSGAEGSKAQDAVVSDGEKDYVVKVLSLPTGINTLTLSEGRLPEKDGELAVERGMLKKAAFTLGGMITFDDDVLGHRAYTIVGIVESPLYFNSTDVKGTRGMTSLGTGSVDFYAFAPKDSIDTDYYTGAYMTVAGAAAYKTGADDYLSAVGAAVSAVEGIRSDREQARHDALYQDLSSEIDDRQAEADQKLGDAKAELDSAKSALDQGKRTLDDKKAALDTAKSQLDVNDKKYRDTLAALGIAEADIDGKLAQVQEALSAVEAALGQLPPDSPGYAQYTAQAETLRANLSSLQMLKASGEALRSAKADYKSGKAAYDKASDEYQNKLKEYEDGLADYNANKTDAEQKIADARQKLGELEMPKWYVYDRTDDSTYSDYINDTQSIANLSVIFPTVFFVVAVLISLISMNRMVEEDRNQIGTLKSLGFSNGQILFKYLLFAFTATLAGGVIGAGLGVVIIPKLIWNIYRILFTLPAFILDINLPSTLAGLLIAMACICGTTIYTALRELRHRPAELMRPKAPKPGKRILLERIGFLWNHLKFSKKVTARNIFRYPKRVLMTVVGILGCTALMLSGFGLRDAIVDIPPSQFENVYTYSIAAYVKAGLTDEEAAAVFSSKEITERVAVDSVSGTAGSTEVTLFVPEDADALPQIINLKDLSSGEAVTLSDGAVITDKLASLLGIGVGDEITVTDSDSRPYTFRVTNIAEYYIGHAVFVSRNLFETVGGAYRTNIEFLKTVPLSEAAEDALCAALQASDSVLSVSSIRTLVTNAENMLKSLDSVVLILIILASMLSFVVLYNLSNININERKRELATLKVLGFFDGEVDRYITMETVLLTLFGIALGLVFGTFLTNVIVSTVEIERVRFIHRIAFMSYVYSAALAVLFTVIVNAITHFTLKRIDMIESLKSVE